MISFFNILSDFTPHAFHFLRPWALWLYIPLIIVVLLLVLSNREQKNWKNIIAPALRPYMFSKSSKKAIILPLLSLFFGLFFMILALAGPTWKKRIIPGEKVPAVVLISLDMSKSMTATDIQPSRLERAKMKISDFLDANPRARAGLIGFAGTPHMVLPFTADYKLVKHHTRSLYNWEMPVQGTNMALNIGLIDTLMKHVEAPSTILLMTDVINDNEAVMLSDYINNSIHKLEILLFSTPNGAIIPKTNIISQQSPTALNNLKQNDKINITTITLDKSDVEDIAKRISDKLVFEKDKKQDAQEWDDKGIWLLFPALLILLLWFRKGWVVQWCWIPLLIINFSSCSPESKHADWWYSADYRAEKLYEKGNYEQAAELFTDNIHKAAAYFKNEDFQSVVELLADDTTAIGKYNYGLALAKLGYYDEAITAFQNAASLDASLQEQSLHNIDASKLMKDQAESILRFHPHINSIDSILKNTVKEKLKEHKPKPEEEQLSSDTEVKKLPTKGDRASDEVQSNIHRAKEQKFPPKDFKMDKQTPIETRVLMQKTNADPGEFLHRRFEIQKQKYYPDVKQEKEDW